MKEKDETAVAIIEAFGGATKCARSCDLALTTVQSWPSRGISQERMDWIKAHRYRQWRRAMDSLKEEQKA